MDKWAQPWPSVDREDLAPTDGRRYAFEVFE